jgi:thiamine pyrophosphokinase
MRRIDLPTIDLEAETVILANGEFPRSEIALSIIEKAQFLVCCDGATNQLIENHSRIPDAIVGDCDSVSKENFERFSNIVHRIPEQDTNDLTKAVNFCRANHRTCITILGATGKREDHTLANISLLARYLDIENSDFRMVTDHGVFVAIGSDSEFQSYAGQQVSLFNMGKASATSFNLKYPLENRVLNSLWEGTLNESLGDSFQLLTNGKIVVFREF